MTNEQKVKNMTKGFLKEGLIKKSRIQELLIKAMDWKDKQFAQEKQQLIDDACKWLEVNDSYAKPTNLQVDRLREHLNNKLKEE